MTEQVRHFAFRGGKPLRLDKYLVSQLAEHSRSQIQKWIKEGKVFVEGEAVTKAGYLLEKPVNIVVRIPPPAPAQLVPESIPLDVLFENEDVIVVNKPAGMVVHPSAGHSSGTLVHAALAHAPDIQGVGGVQRPGIVHRLDKDTSGIILLAKNDYAHRWLQSQFKQRQVEKWYLALVDGAPPTPTGRVEAPIGRDPSHRQRMAVVPSHKGRQAITEYRTLQTFEKHTLLEVHLLTGRTHQIRVHMAFLKCPVVGDTIYGRRRPSLPLSRYFLHAARLQITLPGEEDPRLFEAPLPEELVQLLETLE